MTTSWRSCSRLPRMRSSGVAEMSSVMPRSVASERIDAAEPSTTAPRSSSSYATAPLVSPRATASRESTSDESRSVSDTISDASSLVGSLSWRNSALARITARGVRSSWLASATKTFWRSNASWTGVSAFPARNQPPIVATTTAAPPPRSSTTRRWSSASSSGSSDRATWRTSVGRIRSESTRRCPPGADTVRISDPFDQRGLGGRLVDRALAGLARRVGERDPVRRRGGVRQGDDEREALGAVPRQTRAAWTCRPWFTFEKSWWRSTR